MHAPNFLLPKQDTLLEVCISSLLVTGCSCTDNAVLHHLHTFAVQSTETTNTLIFFNIEEKTIA